MHGVYFRVCPERRSSQFPLDSTAGQDSRELLSVREKPNLDKVRPGKSKARKWLPERLEGPAPSRCGSREAGVCPHHCGAVQLLLIVEILTTPIGAWIAGESERPPEGGKSEGEATTVRPGCPLQTYLLILKWA